MTGAVSATAAAASRSRASRPSLFFVLAVSFGILLLWVAGVVALLAVGGDCAGSEAECRAASDIQAGHARVLLATVAGLSVLGFLAIRSVGPVAPAALLIAAIGTMVLGNASGIPAFAWASGGFGLTTLPLAILALAAAGQVVHQTTWRPGWLRG